MPLPTIDDYPKQFRFRFCPLCATPLVRRLDDEIERLVCPQDGWTLYPTPNLAATIVIEHQGGVVLLQRAIEPDAGIWHLPIGHLEFGEPPAAAAVREAHEETGLQLDEPELLDFEYSPAIGNPAMFYMIFCYTARAVGGELRVNGENSAARICPPEQLPELAWSSQRRALAVWRERRAGRPWTIGQKIIPA